MKTLRYILLFTLIFGGTGCGGGGEIKKKFSPTPKGPPKVLHAWHFQKMPSEIFQLLKLDESLMVKKALSAQAKPFSEAGVIQGAHPFLSLNEPPQILKTHGKIYGLAFSPDGKILAGAGEDKTISLWNIGSRKAIHLLVGHKRAVRSLAFSPDGKTLASASEDKTIGLWNGKTGAFLKNLKGHREAVYSVAFSPDGKTLASGSWDRSIRFWNLATGKASSTLMSDSWYVFSVAFSPDGKTLASANYDRAVRLWDVATGEEKATMKGTPKPAYKTRGKYLSFPGHSDWVHQVAFSPDGKILASASEDKTIRLWNGKTGAFLAVLKGHQKWVKALAFSGDGKILASAGGEGVIYFWDMTSGKLVKKLQQHTGPVEVLAFSHGLLASAGADKKIVISRVGGTRLDFPQGSFMSLSQSVSTDGKLIVALGQDHKLHLFDTVRGEQLALWNPPGGLRDFGFVFSRLIWVLDGEGKNQFYYLSDRKLDLSPGPFQIKATPEITLDLSPSRVVAPGEKITLNITLNYKKSPAPLYQFALLVSCGANENVDLIVLGNVPSGTQKTFPFSLKCQSSWRGKKLWGEVRSCEQYNYAPQPEKIEFWVKKNP